MLDEFLRRITKIKSDIDKLGNYTDKTRDLHGKKLRDVLSGDEEKKISEQVAVVADLFQKQSRAVKNELECINSENNGIKKKCKEDSLEYQSRNLHWQRCTKNLTTEINRFRQEQLKYAKGEKDKLRAQCIAINPGTTEEEISEMLAKEDSDVMMQKILAGGGSESSKRRLEEVKSKNVKIRSMTKKLDELLEMINGLQKMVNRSGTVVDKIEVKMAKTKTSTEAANRDLESAYRYQVSRMWLKRIAYGIILFVFVILAMYLAIKFAPSFVQGSNNNK